MLLHAIQPNADAVTYEKLHVFSPGQFTFSLFIRWLQPAFHCLQPWQLSETMLGGFLPCTTHVCSSCPKRRLHQKQTAESSKASTGCHQRFSSDSLQELLTKSRKLHLAWLRLVLVLDVSLRAALGGLLATLGRRRTVCPLAFETVELLLELCGVVVVTLVIVIFVT
jgi:hypothetical protein